jgi:hypothetical protein
MDPARQSAIVGAVLGTAVAAMGVAIAAIAFRAPEASINIPRPLLAFMGLGIACCGGAFAVVTFHKRLGFTLAIPGAALGFLLPIAWFALTPGVRECTVSFVSANGASLSRAWSLGSSTCHAIIVIAALAALAVVGGMAWAWWRIGDPRRHE